MDDDNPPNEDELEELASDAELWESGELGNDPETARRSRSAEELSALDASLGLTKVRVGLDEGLHEALKERAEGDGVGLPSVHRAAISRYLTRHGGRILDDEEAGEGAVECVFRMSSDDFLALVDLARREDVLPRTVVRAAFAAYVTQ